MTPEMAEDMPRVERFRRRLAEENTTARGMLRRWWREWPIYGLLPAFLWHRGDRK